MHGKITTLNLDNQQREKMIDRVVSRTRSGSGGCIEWTGAKNKKDGDRGCIKVIGMNRNMLAPRAVYELFIGDIPDGLLVCHSCDNPRCVKPAHLFAGTQSENMTDCVKKNRHSEIKAHGSNHCRAKLSDSDVVAIRDLHEDGVSQLALSERFKVNSSTINQIVNRKSWTHL